MATPTISSIAPASGNTGGGLLVTITGTNLADAVSAKFGGVVTAVVGTPTATTAKFRTPKKASTGQVDVIVTNTSSGDSAATTNGFNYSSKPAYGSSRGPDGSIVAPENVYTQGDSVSSVTRPGVLTAQTGQVYTDGSLGGITGAIADWVEVERKNVVWGHPDRTALLT